MNKKLEIVAWIFAVVLVAWASFDSWEDHLCSDLVEGKEYYVHGYYWDQIERCRLTKKKGHLLIFDGHNTIPAYKVISEVE